MRVTIIRTGTANLASVRAGLERAGAEPVPASSATDVSSARFVVLPGVGAFGPARARLEDQGIGDALIDRVAEGRPTLAICLGMQLLCEGSDETPDVPGLGCIPGIVERFADGAPVPQLGWNRVEPEPVSQYLRPGYAYFAHSYRLAFPPEGWTATFTDYSGRFVSAVERQGMLATQFHPELSGLWGVELLRRWLAVAEIAC